MAIRARDVSQENVDAVQQHLSERALTRSAPADAALSAAHDVYSPRVDDLAAGRGLSAAERVAVAFLVMDGSRAVASVEHDTERGAVSSTEGPFSEATAEAIRRAEADPELADGDYELRELRVPGLYLMAVWLKDLSGDGDVVIPLEPAPAPLQAGRSYRLPQLEPELESMSRARLAFEDV
jgi:hypothetical protein